MGITSRCKRTSSPYPGDLREPSTAPTNETCCGAQLHDQYGDYEGIAAMDGSVHPVWTDRRAAVAPLDEEIFTATITVK